MILAKSSRTLLLLNQTWFSAELRRLGCEVITAGWSHPHFDIQFERSTHIDDIISRIEQKRNVDGVVYFDDSYACSVVGIEQLQIPSVFYSIYAHHHFQWHRYFGAAFDRVLCAQKDYLRHLLPIGDEEIAAHRLSWLPLWAPQHIEPDQERDIEVCFRGTLDPDLHPDRARFFNTLREHVAVDAASGDVVEAYQRSKIVINQTVRGDLNFRVFEAMMAGAMLITPLTSNGLGELFEDGVDLVTYERDNPDDAALKIKHFLSNIKQREMIARSGRAKVLQHHSGDARAADLLRLIPTSKGPFSTIHNYGAAFATLFSLGLEIRRLGSDWPRNDACLRLLDSSFNSICAAVSLKETLNDEIRGAIFMAKYSLEKCGAHEKVSELGRLAYEAYPDDAMIGVSYIDDLVRSGQEELARTVSARISDTPDRLISHVPRLMEDARLRLDTTYAQ